MKLSGIVHEYSENGQHRIILIDEAGDVNPGEWAPFTGIASNAGYLATTEYYIGALPTGIFQVKKVAHKVMSA